MSSPTQVSRQISRKPSQIERLPSNPDRRPSSLKRGSVFARRSSTTLNSQAPSSVGPQETTAEVAQVETVSSKERREFSSTIKRLELNLAQLRDENFELANQIRQIRDSHEEEVKRLQTQLSKAGHTRHEEQKKLDRFESLRSSIVTLILEFRDKSVEGEGDMLNIKEERNRLMLMDGLQLVDVLKSSLTLLAQFKQDFENELRSNIHRMKSAEEERIATLEATCQEHRDNYMKYRQMYEENERQLSILPDDPVGVINESKRVIEELQSDNKELTEELKAKDAKVSELAKEIDNRDIVIKNQTLKLVHMPMLEKKIAMDKAKYLSKIKSGQEASIKEKQKLQRESALYKSERDGLVLKVKDAEKEVVNIRTNMNRSHLEEADRMIQKMLRTIEHQNVLNDELLRELRRADPLAVSKFMDRPMTSFQDWGVASKDNPTSQVPAWATSTT